MVTRPANDTTSAASTVDEIYVIDPATKLPVAPASSTDIDDLTTAVNDLAAPATVLPPKPLRVDVGSFPTRTIFSVTGADTDELIAAGGAGVQTYVFSGWLQTDIATVLTFKSATTAIWADISLAAGESLKIGGPNAELPELYTAAAQALNLTKSTAATVKGVLFSRAV